MMQAAAKAIRVLVVEDDVMLARVYSRALTAAGFSVDLAADGAEGFERLLASSYDVVLSDLRMPRMDGLDLLRQVQRMRPNVAVVLMTAALDNATYAAAREIMESVRYLAKPMTMEHLARAVKTAATLRAARLGPADRRAPSR
jgi:DNA-binding NtrC family response regulator